MTVACTPLASPWGSGIPNLESLLPLVPVVVSSPAMDWKNKLYFGDNREILREHVASGSIDLIYLDPPFNSSASYNVLFKEKSGEESAAQITAFEDTWQWSVEAEGVYKELVTSGPRKIADHGAVVIETARIEGLAMRRVDKAPHPLDKCERNFGIVNVLSAVFMPFLFPSCEVWLHLFSGQQKNLL